MKFYHSSPNRFRHGDILTGNRKGGYGSMHHNVCITTSPMPHATISSRIPGWHGFNPDYVSQQIEYFKSHSKEAWTKEDWAKQELENLLLIQKNQSNKVDWFVYEVEPHNCDPIYVGGNCEYQVRSAKVIKNIGKASAFLQKKIHHADDRRARAFDFDVEKKIKDKQRERDFRKLQKQTY